VTIVYETERLVIRPWTHSESDVDRIFDLYSQWEVARWLGATPTALTERAQAEAAVDRWAARSVGEFGVWAVEVRATEVVAGTVLLVPLPSSASFSDDASLPDDASVSDHASLPDDGSSSEDASLPDDGSSSDDASFPDDVEVGWHLHPDSWGHGYATEAARGAIAKGFGAGLTEIYAVVRPDNERSIAVCRRLGMTPLGRTARWYGTELEAFRVARQDREE
jgi:RimJ/RimL family protein N-acetyltransferase